MLTWKRQLAGIVPEIVGGKRQVARAGVGTDELGVAGAPGGEAAPPVLAFGEAGVEGGAGGQQIAPLVRHAEAPEDGGQDVDVAREARGVARCDAGPRDEQWHRQHLFVERRAVEGTGRRTWGC